MPPNAPAMLCLLATAVYFQPPAHAADGCADGTFSRVTSPDGNATSLLYDDFSATSGAGVGASRSRSTCTFDVPVTKPNGYSVFSVDYRGFVTTQDGQTAKILTRQDGVKVFQHQITGPVEDDVGVGHRVGVSSSQNFDLTVTVGTDAPIVPDDPDASLLLDTIDVTRIGFTTRQSVQQSLDQLARHRQSVAGELRATAEDLLGHSDRFDDGSSLSFFGNSSAAAGFNGRWEAGKGISLLGGAAIVNPDATDPAVASSPLFAGAVRYTTPQAAWRAFGEAGFYGSPSITTELTRSYLNADNVIDAGGSVSGSSVNMYGRLGAIFAPNDNDEFAVSVHFGKSWLNLDGYSETRTDQNLFGATIRGGASSENTVSAKLAWSHKIDGRFDYTLSAEAGRVFSDHDAVQASVDWVGNITGKAKDLTFATGAGRLGFRLDEVWKLDVSLAARLLQSDEVRWSAGARLKASF